MRGIAGMFSDAVVTCEATFARKTGSEGLMPATSTHAVCEWLRLRGEGNPYAFATLTPLAHEPWEAPQRQPARESHPHEYWSLARNRASV